MNFRQRDLNDSCGAEALNVPGITTQVITLPTSGSSSDGDPPPITPPTHPYPFSLHPQALPTILLFYFVPLATLLSAQIATSITSVSLSSSPSPRLPPSGLINQLTHTSLEHEVTDIAPFFFFKCLKLSSVAIWKWPKAWEVTRDEDNRGWDKLDKTLW